jgi:hypothetical protein
MLVLAFLLAQTVATPPAAKPTPVPTPRPAPALGRTSEPAREKSLSDHAKEMKAKGTPAKPVSFDDVRVVEPAEAEDFADAPTGRTDKPKKAGATTDGGNSSPDAAAAQAQKRMDRAVQKGLDVPECTSTSRRDKARREWDEAAEACRRTPGCVPQYRDDARYGENKPLKTDQELIEDIRKRGFSEPHPLPRK